MVDIRQDSFPYQRLCLPKYYANVNQVKDVADLNHENMDIEIGDWDDYRFQDSLGSGASGTAYIGIKISTGEKVVIKTFYDDIKSSSIKREIKIL